METNQHRNRPKIFCRASFKQRLTAIVIFLVVFSLFGLLWLAATGKLNLSLLITPCGFKQRYALPCPTCGMTTSAMAFASGRILESFCIQPAAAFLCCLLVLAAFFALLTACFGVYFSFLKWFFPKVKIQFVVFAVIAVVAVGWIVTLLRALAENGRI